MIGYEEKLTGLQTFVKRVQKAAEDKHIGYIVSIHTDDQFTAKPSVLLAPGTVTFIDHRDNQEQK